MRRRPVGPKPLISEGVSSDVVRQCQICHSPNLEKILFLGYLPLVNTLDRIGELPHEEPYYPALLLFCPMCHLAQLGLIIDPTIVFPKEYPYTSGTTKILRDNFVELSRECRSLIILRKDDLLIDIGSNDGTLLSNFVSSNRVYGITPENIGYSAIERGIPTCIAYFNTKVTEQILDQNGPAKVITATNVLAHIDHVHDVIRNILKILDRDGAFISESHYFPSLIQTLQYDAIYHEHLRYYSLTSLKHLFDQHGLEIFHAKRIPTHGGSIRVYAARKGMYPVQDGVLRIFEDEKEQISKKEIFMDFKNNVLLSKLELQSLLLHLKRRKKRIVGIGAPSRATTLINYVGLDEEILDYVVEIKGSNKIGHYVPGTLIPIVEETRIYTDQPDYALLLSWHIAEELAPKIKGQGFKGDYIIPLPCPRILENAKVKSI
jgi:hypothetical protein